MEILKGKVAIVTGAARGQGEATARLFVAEGARVILTDLDAAAVTSVAQSLGEHAVAMKQDIGDEDGWKRVVELALGQSGAIDVLINNAGIFRTGAIDSATRADLERMFHVNVVGAFLGIRTTFPHMRRDSGSIVNIASGAGLNGMANMLAYSTSKWALRGLSRSAARDLAPRGVRVNTICPGVIDTPMIRNDALPGFFDQVKAGIPLARTGVPRDIASASLFLASDASSFMTGAEIVVDGGRHA